MVEVIEGMEAVTVHVRDVAKARKFYAEVLGLREVDARPDSPRAAFEIPGTTTLLTMHVMGPDEGGREPGTVSGVLFSHRDPVAAFAELERRGAKILHEPDTFEAPIGTVTLGVFADPDGNEFVLRHVTARPR